MSDSWQREFAALRACGVMLAPGLQAAELGHAENVCGVQFPPDLRSLLSVALPSGPRFPDWRSPESVRQQLEWPAEGIAFDVEHSEFWPKVWGSKPGDLAEALSVARAEVRKAPRLVPIFGHRYLPAEPSEPGNPVFSVYQTDVIYYGVDLSAYLMHEFGPTSYAEAVQGSPRHIRFWSELAA